jgi:hypothetical protein
VEEQYSAALIDDTKGWCNTSPFFMWLKSED